MPLSIATAPSVCGPFPTVWSSCVQGRNSFLGSAGGAAAIHAGFGPIDRVKDPLGMDQYCGGAPAGRQQFDFTCRKQWKIQGRSSQSLKQMHEFH